MKTGDFLLEKLLNMAKWLDASLGLCIGAEADKLSAVQATLLAAKVGAHREVAEQRDWDAMLVVVERDAPMLLHAATMVRTRPDLHDKFWRYIELFVKITNQ